MERTISCDESVVRTWCVDGVFVGEFYSGTHFRVKVEVRVSPCRLTDAI